MDGPTIATLVVAAATVLLAFATFRLGTRAAEDTRAQWRPVVLVRARRDAGDEKIAAGPVGLTVSVENVGRGPALDVSARRSDRMQVHQRISALAPGEAADVAIPLGADEVNAVAGLSLAYADLSHAGYGTWIIIDLSTGTDLVMQRFESHPPLSFWWQMIVPRRLRHRLWPLTRWLLRRRGYFIP